MKALIIYSSPTGTVKRCAGELAALIPGAELHELGKKGNPRPDGYDMVIVGGSIRGGGLTPLTQMYLEECEEILLTKQLGLFICCGTDANAEAYMSDNISPELMKHAKAAMGFGGELVPERARGFIDRMMVKQMLKADKKQGPGLQLHLERIPEFASKMLAGN